MFQHRFRYLLDNQLELEELHKSYITADPFPHIALDGVFTEGALFDICTEFPKPDPSWWKYENSFERKYAKDDGLDEFPHIQQAISLLQSRRFVTFLERLTGISGLIVDHSLRGGGLHQIARGGKLDLHADHNFHPVLKLDRRLNVLLYLNRNWDPLWKGDLELWAHDDDGELTECKVKIAPKLGRVVVFSTNDTSYHGHPEPLECPEGITRKSIALYYWSNGRPDHEQSPAHSTIYKRRPQDPYDPALDQMRAARAKGRIK
jgi:hypothetical protein